MNKIKYSFILIITLSFLASCQNSLKEDSFNAQSISEQLIGEDFYSSLKVQDTTPIHIESFSVENAHLQRMVNISAVDISLARAISMVDDNFTIVSDNVDVKTKIPFIKFNNTLEKYFSLLEGITGYAIKLKDKNVVNISANLSKTWNVATLSEDVDSNISSAAQEENITDGDSTNQGNAWDDLLANLNTFKESRGLNVDLLNNKKTGIITGFGSPRDIAAIDDYLEDLILLTNKQIHIKAQVLDVTVDKSTGRGIDWNLISNQSTGVKISNNVTPSIDGAGIFSIGDTSPIDLGRKITLGLLLNLLSKQGKVKIVNQPNLTVTNGTSAYITTGDEFSYIAGVDSNTDAQGQVTTTPKLERITVGVEMKVTAKVLDNDRVLVNIVPVVTSLKGFDSFTFNQQSFKTPNIALQKLATQVIVKSGETIPLGGLIADKISDASKGAVSDKNPLSFFFNGVEQSVERREIVMLITPTIVGS